MRILFQTLGCRLNQAETDEYQEELANRGFTIVNFNQEFDIAIINSCAVTHKAERETRQIIRKLKKQCPEAKIILTGCADLKLPEINYYIKDKENFVEKFFSYFISPSPRMWRGLASPKRFAKARGRGVRREMRRTRVNIKIQTGCDNCCTYCYTRISRGRSRSFPPELIVKNINDKHEQGAQEVVLCGVNIGQYSSPPLFPLSINMEKGKKDKTLIDLTELIKIILKEISIPRIRLSSINPEYVYRNKKFQALFANPRLCQHLHLSLQSGSDAILKKMNRHYTARQYITIVKSYYKKYPDFGFTTDVIVGFPGETEKDFKATCGFVKKCGFLKIHVFRYSKRKGTAATKMAGQVAEIIKQKRMRILHQLNTELQAEFQKKMQGRKLAVLFEGKRGGYYLGHAGNFLFFKQRSSRNLINRIQAIYFTNQK